MYRLHVVTNQPQAPATDNLLHCRFLGCGPESGRLEIAGSPLHSLRVRSVHSHNPTTLGGPVPDEVKAYILIQTAVNVAQVARDIRELDGIEAADDVSGPYDVIVRASADSMDSLGRMVVARIQTIEGVTRTLTCPVVSL
ncbi:MAG: Lrp/AsnC ligand binding domain-containing protein [Actinobacteria bacterium]|nr:Lrp/AsnC ligand binding domain-containing protein [Actinomycetota bacterium]